jgi:hypothetical protein
MTSYITTLFRGVPHDASIESTTHRWVARLEALGIEIERADAVVERVGRKTAVSLIVRTSGGSSSASQVHDDPYVAVSNAFRSIRHGIQVTAKQPARSRWAYA